MRVEDCLLPTLPVSAVPSRARDPRSRMVRRRGPRAGMHSAPFFMVGEERVQDQDMNDQLIQEVSHAGD